MKKVQKFILLSLCLLFAANIQAQRGPGSPEKMKAIRQESQQYIKEEVLPAVKNWRKAFDVHLSSQEKAAIAELRVEMKGHRRAMAGFMETHRKQKEAGQPISEQQRAEMRQMRDRLRASMEKLHPIAEAHMQELENLRKANNNQLTVWRDDLKGIFESHFSDAELKEMKERRGEHGHHAGGKRADRGHRQHARGNRAGKSHPPHGILKLLRPAGFILLDPSVEEEGFDGETLPFEEEDYELESQFYPNPAGIDSRVAFHTESTGAVRIELLSQSGELLKTHSYEALPAGRHELSVDLSGMKPGVYLYRVITVDGVSTRRFIKD